MFTTTDKSSHRILRYQGYFSTSRYLPPQQNAEQLRKNIFNSQSAVRLFVGGSKFSAELGMLNVVLQVKMVQLAGSSAPIPAVIASIIQDKTVSSV